MEKENLNRVLGCCADKSCVENTCMWLPDNLTCADCKHVYRCCSIFGSKETDKDCQFFPRRFLFEERGLGR